MPNPSTDLSAMPRQPRYFLTGIPQHVVARGVDHQATFFAPSDFTLFLTVLRESSVEHQCAIHAYVLMTNHIHLLLTPGEPRAIPKLMQGLGRSYIQAINRHYQRSGPLWEGRYKASLVQADDYFLACQRYIELNPVRAGLVTAPAEYVFSSYLCNALGQVDYLITPHPVYQALGGSNKARQTAYRKLFDSSISASTIEAIRKTTNACRVLGDDRFIDQVEAMLQRRIRSNPRGRPVGSKSS